MANILILPNVKCTGYTDVKTATNGKKYIKFDALDESTKSVFKCTIWESAPCFKNVSEHRIIRRGDYYVVTAEATMQLKEVGDNVLSVPFISVQKIEWLKGMKSTEESVTTVNTEVPKQKVSGFGM